MIINFPKNIDISVVTFCTDNSLGDSPRAFYKSIGFSEGEYTFEYGIKQQKFYLKNSTT